MSLHELLIKTLSAENDLRAQVSNARRQEEAFLISLGDMKCPSSK